MPSFNLIDSIFHHYYGIIFSQNNPHKKQANKIKISVVFFSTDSQKQPNKQSPQTYCQIVGDICI